MLIFAVDIWSMLFIYDSLLSLDNKDLELLNKDVN